MSEGLTRKQTTMLQGAAICMMIFHHLFLVEGFLGEGCRLIFTRGGIHTELYVAWFCKLCVGLYAWLSGYGLQRSLTRTTKPENPAKKIWNDSWKAVLKRFLSFYKHFVFVAVPSLLIMFRIAPWPFDPRIFITDVLGLSAVYNGTWWYVAEYVKMLILLPFIHLFFTRLCPEESESRKRRVYALAVIASAILLLAVRRVNPALWGQFKEFYNKSYPEFILCFISGYIVGRYRIFEKIDDILFSRTKSAGGGSAPKEAAGAIGCAEGEGEDGDVTAPDGSAVNAGGAAAASEKLEGKPFIGIVFGLIILVLTFVVRVSITRDPSFADYDFIFAPCFAYAFSKIVPETGVLGLLFYHLGRQSFTMWLIHVFFMDPSLVWLVYRLGFNISPGVFISLLLLSYLTALCFSLCESLLGKLIKVVI